MLDTVSQPLFAENYSRRKGRESPWCAIGHTQASVSDTQSAWGEASEPSMRYSKEGVGRYLASRSVNQPGHSFSGRCHHRYGGNRAYNSW